MPLEIDFLGEGRSDEAVARTLICAAGHRPGRSYVRPISGTGKANLDRRLAGLNRGAAFGRPVLVLRDLDHDAPCPAALVGDLLPDRHPRMLLRIAVREIETWLLADRAAYARFCGIMPRVMPGALERASDLKRLIVSIAEQNRNSKLARHVTDGRRRGLPDWQILGEWHAAFAADVREPRHAAASGDAPSLARALDRLSRLPGCRTS